MIQPPDISAGDLPLHGDYNALIEKAFAQGPPQFIPLKPVFTEDIVGTLDGDLSYGNTATLSVYTGDLNSETDSGRNETVGTKLLASGKKLASGNWCHACKIGPNWYVYASNNCPVDA